MSDLSSTNAQYELHILSGDYCENTHRLDFPAVDNRIVPLGLSIVMVTCLQAAIPLFLTCLVPL